MLRNHHNQFTMSIHEGVIEALAPTHFTSFWGRRPTTTDIDTLEKEAAKLAASVKTTLFPQGLRHGHLSCILSNEAYGAIIGDSNYAWEEPDANLLAYNPDITAGMAVIVRKQREVAWDRKKEDSQHYLGVAESIRSRSKQL